MILYKDYVTFYILGEEFNIISDETDYGINTIVEVGDKYHYLGDETPNIASAILAWQEINKRDLTDEEMNRVLTENYFYSNTI